MDTSRLRKGERIAAVSGIALFVFMFFDWFGVEGSAGVFGSVEVAGSAWEVFSFIDIVLFAACLVAVGLAVLTVTQRSVNLPVAASAITAALGILAVVLIVFRIIDPPIDTGVSAVDETRKIGVFLGLIAAAGVAVGGWLSMQEEGTSFSEAREQLSDAISAPGTPSEPASPGGGESPPSPPATGGEGEQAEGEQGQGGPPGGGVA